MPMSSFSGIDKVGEGGSKPLVTFKTTTAASTEPPIRVQNPVTLDFSASSWAVKKCWETVDEYVDNNKSGKTLEKLGQIQNTITG